MTQKAEDDIQGNYVPVLIKILGPYLFTGVRAYENRHYVDFLWI